MSRRMQVTSENLNEKGGFFTEKSIEMDKILEELDDAKVEVMEMWKGSSSNSIIRQYEELRPMVDKFMDLTREIGEHLKNIAHTIEETDNQIANQKND